MKQQHHSTGEVLAALRSVLFTHTHEMLQQEVKLPA
jgi:hypothetical protein